MKKFSKILLLSVLSIFLVVGTAMAVPFNTRPVAVYDPDGETNLDDVFDALGLTGAGYDVVGSQSSAAVFTHGAVGTLSTFVFTDLSSSLFNFDFGLYSYADQTKLLPLFTDNHTSSTTVSFYNDGSVEAYGSPSSGYSTGIIAGFGDNFGFYITTSGSINSPGTYYSEDDKNVENDPWILTYQGQEGVYLNSYNNYAGGFFGVDDWLIASDGATHGNPVNNLWDYDECVVLVESIKPVHPVHEPATMLLLGAGLIGLAGMGRKKFFKKS